MQGIQKVILTQKLHYFQIEGWKRARKVRMKLNSTTIENFVIQRGIAQIDLLKGKIK
jgi:hypothetical protein